MALRQAAVSMCLIAAAVVVVSCSSGTGGRAEPAAGIPTGGPTSQAPKVDQPLNASTLVAQPCSSLTTGNVTGIGLSNPVNSPDKDANGTSCVWAGEAGGSIAVSWVTANTHGLSDLYVKQSTFSYWQPTTIAGYPAVYADALGDHRSDGDCVLYVGASDQLAFFTEYDNPGDAAHACPLAGKAAADVIANLKGGA